MDNLERIKQKTRMKLAISSFQKEERNEISKNKLFKEIIVASLMIVSLSGIVFAKDLEKIIKKAFTSSTRAIDLAEENGYIQETNMDYIYDNNIGIRISNFILDNQNLAIEFEYNVKKDNVKSIQIEEYSFLTGDGKPINNKSSKYDEIPLANQVTWGDVKQIVPSETTYRSSAIFGLRELEYELDELIFDINSMKVFYEDDSSEEITGEWNFNVKVDEKMKKSNTLEYIMAEPNEYIERCTGTLSLTGLRIEIVFKEPYDMMEWFNNKFKNISEGDVIEFEAPFYIVKDGEKIIPTSDLSGSDRTLDESEIDRVNVIKYNNISSFDDINEFEVYIEPYNISVNLTKENK